MHVGDQVQVQKGPYGGMMGTIVTIRIQKVYRRGKGHNKPLDTPVATIQTPILRTIWSNVVNLKLTNG